MAAAVPVPAASASASAAPNWVLLEPFVFRRDKDTEKESSFPDETKAPIRASGATSLDAPFNVAFSLAEPPRISRLYAQLPGFPGPKKERPLAILASHRHLALFRVATCVSGGFTWQDFFIYDSTSKSCSLQALPPPCTEAAADYLRGDGRLPRRKRAEDGASAERRLLSVKSMGIFCPYEGSNAFAVAELNLFKPNSTKVHADICFFRSVLCPGDHIYGEWDTVRVPIHYRRGTDDLWQLCLWQTDAVIPVDRWLCWVDYYRGILFCDLLAQPDPTVSFLRSPLGKFPDTHNRSVASSWLYRGVTPIHAGRVLKFVDVARNDGIGYGALRPHASFTITCHTLTLPLVSMESKGTLKSMLWIKDGLAINSSELWADARLPHEVLMFPQVDIDRPNVVHFLVSSYGYVMLKMWIVTVDMNTRAVETVTPYINGLEDKGTEDADLTKARSRCPMPFLSCEFSKHLASPVVSISRRRNYVEY